MTLIRISLFLFLSFFNSLNIFSQEQAIEVIYQKLEGGYTFFATNHSNVPYYVKFQFTGLKNLKANHNLENYTPVIYPNQDAKAVLKLQVADPSKSSSFNFNYQYTIGEPNLAIDKDFQYWFPFSHGKRVRVGQGNNGKGTHQGINAIDFNLSIGDTVYGAREGFVFEVKEDSNKGGPDESFEKYGNFINVYHPDGTIAKYVHLQKNGSLVKVGDSIQAGQAIGISGNTGYSSGPHLHFMVVHNENFQSKTLPVTFLTYEQKGVIPIENKSYYGYHPGELSFEVQDESSFNENKLEQQKINSTLKNQIKIESESYGDYTLIYVNNGMADQVSGKLMIELINMQSTKKIPHEFSVAAHSKKYLLAIQPKENAEQFSYKLSAEFRK